MTVRIESRRAVPRGSVVLAIMACLLPGPVSTAQDEDAEYARFRAAVESYQITVGASGEALQLDAGSLLEWTNPVRQQERGSVFIWLRDGRPSVISSFFTYEHEGKVYDKAEFHSLADERLRMTRDGEECWTPKPGLKWESVRGVADPAPSERQRLVQMRSIARGYRVRLFDLEGEPTELRFLAQPLYRYNAPAQGVLDGAIFSYAVATDPEALLIVEAAGDAAAPQWRCAFARFHYWRLEAATSAGNVAWSAELDRTQESHVIGDVAQFEKPYVSFRPTTDAVRSVEP
jgi:hypothetical protein